MRILLILSAIAAMNSVHAEEFCATNALELQNALGIAQSNGEADIVRVATGTYIGNFVYDSSGHSSEGSDSLAIIGGYSELSGNPCGVFVSPDPVRTMIDGSGSARVLTIIGQPSSTVEVRNLAFINGDATHSDDPRGGGLLIRGSGGEIAHAVIGNNLFSGNTAETGGALDVSAAFVGLRNTVIAGNNSVSSYAVTLSSAAPGVHTINNTLIDNTVSGLGSGGLSLALTGSAQALVANNILWGNDRIDLRLLGGLDSRFYIYNNSIDEQLGDAEDSRGNVAVAPEFEPGLFEFTPVADSALIDAGFTPPAPIPDPAPFFLDWGLPLTDLLGRDRVLGGAVDIGAAEALPESLFLNGFEP